RLTLVGGEGRGAGWSGIVALELADEPIIERARRGSGPLRVHEPAPVRICGPYWSAHAAIVPVGAMHVVIFGSDRPLERADVELQQEAAELVAAAGEVPAAKLLADELEVVNAIRGLIEYRPETLADTCRHIAGQAARMLSCELGVVVVRRGERALTETYTHGWEAALDPEALGAALLALVEVHPDGPQLEQDLTAAATKDGFGAAQGLVSRLILPIDEDGALAILAVGHAQARPRGFTDLCQRIGGSLAEASRLLIAQALSREELAAERDRFARVARTDTLTGLHNRNSWEEHLIAEQARLDRYQGACSVASVDIDDLKTTNDAAGHAAGDALIQAVADLLRGQTRTTDHVARVGGDEFLVLLPETDEAGAETFVQRLASAALRWHGPNGAQPLAISIGTATARGADELAAAVAAADARMYANKRQRAGTASAAD
ncbi:MAG: GGDEF domain-containing protein, partial [Candidatus Limnocylindrales bacterium]